MGYEFYKRVPSPHIKMQFANLTIYGVYDGPWDQYLDTVCDHVESDMELTQVPAHPEENNQQERGIKESQNVGYSLASNFH
jgi:hypothetical protein